MSAIALPNVHAKVIAALPMYDFPQLRQATDEFWAAIAKRLNDNGFTNVPAALDRTTDYAGTWSDPNLLLGQVCGYPLVKHLKTRVQVVATPIYSVSGVEDATHRSVFIANTNFRGLELRDLRGSICAVNGFDSNTGMNLLRAAVAPLAESKPFFRSILVTGSHYNSLLAVAEGRADLAAVDCVSLLHFQHLEPELTRRIKAIGQSILTVAPPFITSFQTDAAALALLREALTDLASDPKLEFTLSALLISGFKCKEESDYVDILRIEKDAADLGYPELL